MDLRLLCAEAMILGREERRQTFDEKHFAAALRNYTPSVPVSVTEDLAEIVDTLKCVISFVLAVHRGECVLKLKPVDGLERALCGIVQNSTLNVSEAMRLTVFARAMGTPTDVKVDIIKVMSNLLDEAQSQLALARKEKDYLDRHRMQRGNPKVC